MAEYEASHPRTERETPQARGYDWKWRNFSKAYLSKHPVCALCGSPATVTDHIIPADIWMKVYGQFDYDEANYQPLCNRCNTLKGRHQDVNYRNEFENSVGVVEKKSEKGRSTP